MKTRHATRLILAGVLPALLLGGCSIDVREETQGDQKRVDIRTPVGGMRVNTNVDMPATGLAVYPGARPLQDGEPRSADVDISASVFGVRVLAAKFTSDDAPGDIIDFYRRELGAYGAVTECKGNIDFRGRGGSEEIVCKRKLAARAIQLVAGTKERHRLVSIEPRRGGSEFAVVYIQTRGEG
jgi:hypothetical protein